jgi:hypothetical protein
MRTWGTVVLATGLLVFLGTAPTTRATEGPERVFEPVDVGATMLYGGTNPRRPKAVYVADSIQAAMKFKPFISAATWNKILQIDFLHEVAVATFADVSCTTRFHVVDIARVRLRLMVFGEAVYARSGVGCITPIPLPLSYEVISDQSSAGSGWSPAATRPQPHHRFPPAATMRGSGAMVARDPL